MMSPLLVLFDAIIAGTRHKHVTYFRERLRMEGRRLRDRGIPRIALQTPTLSPFQTMFSSGNDQALIKRTEFDHRESIYLLCQFEPLYLRFLPYGEDGSIVRLTGAAPECPWSMNLSTCLGLALDFY